MASGVATRPIEDFAAYHRELEKFVFRSGQLMRPVMEAAKKDMKRIVFGEGADERVLRAVQTLVDDGVALPILIGRRDEIRKQVREMGLRLKLGDTVQILDPEHDHGVFDPLIETYQALVGRRGIPPDAAERHVTRRSTVSAGMLLQSGHADAAICGGTGDWWRHMKYLLPIIPKRPEVSRVYGLSALITTPGNIFVCDTHVNVDPTAEEIAEMTILAADAVRNFGVVPKVALMSHSSFGTSNSDSARKMRRALAMIREQAPELEVDGEMHPDAALVPSLRERMLQDSHLDGVANLLVMPTLDAANIAFNLVKAVADGLPIGPVLLGMSKPAHVVVPSVTARGIVNVAAVAALQAQLMEQAKLGAARGMGG
jgi:malate dehydrogenase (oxaloacetate-decarboxylating)(NADP+)